jgi:hypothetical protein
MGCGDVNWNEMNQGGIQWQLSYYVPVPSGQNTSE